MTRSPFDGWPARFLGTVAQVCRGERRLLADTPAVILSHLGLLLPGLLLYGFRSEHGLHRLLMPEVQPEEGEVQNLLTYTIGLTGVLVVALHAAVFFLTRRGAGGYREVLASLCRRTWPLAFGLFMLPAVFYEIDEADFFIYLMAPALALSAGLVAHRALRLLPESQAISPAGEAPVQLAVWGAALGVVTLVYTIWWSHVSIAQFRGMQTGLHDLGIYNNLMYNTMQGRLLECGVFRFELIGYDTHLFNNNFFAEHIIPTFWIVTPLYALFPGPEILLVAQSLMLALAAIPLFLIALKKLGSPLIGLLFSIVFLTHPAVHSANIRDFHIDTFIPFFVLGAFAAYLYKWRVLYWVMLLLALGCKEEVSVGVVAMGLFILLGEKDRKTGFLTILAGVAYFVLAVGIAMPYFRGGEPVRQLGRFRHLLVEGYYDPETEITKLELLRSMLFNPGHTIDALVNHARYRAMFYLMGPFLMLFVFSRWVWLWFLPIVGIQMMAGIGVQHGLRSYYAITPLIPVAVGSVYGLRFLLERYERPEFERASRGAVAACTFMFLLAVGIVWYHVANLPGGTYRGDRFVVTPRIAAAEKYFDAIPADAVVSATSRLAGQLSGRRFTYNFPELGTGTYIHPERRSSPPEDLGPDPDRVTDFDVPAEYVLIDTKTRNWPLYAEERYKNYNRWLIAGIVEDPEWGLLLPYTEDGYLLLKRGHSRELNEGLLERIDWEEYDHRASVRRMRREGTLPGR